MRFVFTGSAIVDGTHFERKHLIELAKEQGHIVQARVDGNTTFLVQGETQKVTKKTRVATLSKVQRISPTRFLQLMNFL